MTYLESFILGIIQAATEFLPISSSGHLVIGKNLLGIESPEIVVEVILHLGTLLSIIIYYRNDLRNLIFNSFVNKDTNSQRYILQLAAATIPAVIVGLILKPVITGYFENIVFVSVALLCTGCILFTTRRCSGENKTILWSTALMIGCAQAIAIFPGISRSGITIATALFFGIHLKEAARFSFFLAIPVLVGAGILEIKNITALANINTGPVILGFFSTFIGGLLAIKILLNVIYQKKFWMFAFYCWGIGIITLGYHYI